MSSESDDLEKALQQNLKIRRELGAEVGKADGIQPAKQDRGMVYRLVGFSTGLVSRWRPCQRSFP
jgi:hypothetical protein